VTLRDLFVISTGNLWRMKLRTFLTTSGVLIAIAAFVSMLSFGAGNQEHINNEFNKLGLFSTMQVYPRNRDNVSDTASVAKLDQNAVKRLAAIPGVNIVYPYDAFSVTAKLGDSVFSAKAQALPTAAVQTKLFSNLSAGAAFDSNGSREAIVSFELLKKAGMTVPDSIIGKKLVISVHVSVIDSGLAHILVERGQTILDRVKHVRLDSLVNKQYRTKVLRGEVNETIRRFLNGFINAQSVINDTLIVSGVRGPDRVGRMRIESIIIPASIAARFSSSGFSGNPTEIFSAMSAGTLFARADDPSGKTYSQVTIDFDPKVVYKGIRDSVEALGFRTFSFAAEFEQIQRAFLYFDLALGVIGLIALFTASLGIVNTMVMSITERRREIGVLKSLGADEIDIRLLFLVESGLIGMLGTVAGILFGWAITRVVSAIAQAYMRSQVIPPVDVFALPAWLILIALGVGVGVSVAAGFYPAARAARVDPVEALRND
jgi:ABC-type antimicrobial peptide transport system permease subunit